MEYVIVTGMSGAGKSTALKVLEDSGYYCVDNFPIRLVKNFIDMCEEDQDGIVSDKVAIGIDIRSGEILSEIEFVLRYYIEQNISIRVLFLEASDEVLVKRYKETRRIHPLAGDGGLENGISLERKQLAFLKKSADYIVDTSMLLTRELKKELKKIFVQGKEFNGLYITICSFGFKFGVPADADLVFDVRFLPNPYYVDELRVQTGNDRPVRDYCLKNQVAEDFMVSLTNMIRFLIPNYVQEGRNQLVIAIGCTGGRHRSVAVANQLYENLQGGEYGLRIEHRTIEQDKVRKAE